jgi:hypothetical protein
MDGVQFSTKNNCAVIVRFWHFSDLARCPTYVRKVGQSGNGMSKLIESYWRVIEFLAQMPTDTKIVHTRTSSAANKSASLHC